MSQPSVTQPFLITHWQKTKYLLISQFWKINLVNIVLSLSLKNYRLICHTLILDLKILVQISFLFSDTFKFTVFSTVLQTHIVLLLSPIFLHLKPSKVFSCITSHLKGSLRPLHTFLHFYSIFLHKIIQKGYFGHFLQRNPFLVPTICLWVFSTCLHESSINFCPKNHLSIASNLVWVSLSRFSPQGHFGLFTLNNFFWQRGILKYFIFVVCSF